MHSEKFYENWWLGKHEGPNQAARVTTLLKEGNKETCQSSTDTEQSFKTREIFVLRAATFLLYILISIVIGILYLSACWAHPSNWILIGVVLLFPYESRRDCPLSLLSDQAVGMSHRATAAVSIVKL